MPACALACAHPKASAQASSIAAKPAIGTLDSIARVPAAV